MKKISILLIFLGIGFAIYYGWPSKKEALNLSVPIEKTQKKVIQEEKKPASNKNESPLPRIEKKKKYSQVEKINYFQKIRDTIRDQWKELEECEAEFDLNFGDLIAMGPDKARDNLDDPTNLDIFLEKIRTFNMTTPSSAVMIKQLAEPISEFVNGKEILATVGYVKRCRVQEKAKLLSILSNLKIKNRNTALATIAFFENEISTLTYPDILYEQAWNIETFLNNYGLNILDFPEIAHIKKEYDDYGARLAEIYNRMNPEATSGFKPKVQKEDYDFAVKLQPMIKSLLKKIKKRFI